jgi:signal transduction histidine kinase
MPKPQKRSARLSLAWPALLATVLLLIVLLGAYTLMESRRLQRNLSRELEERATALIGALETSSKNAIASNALLEEVFAQRLLDNARFVDFLLGRSPRAAELIQRVAAENRLAKVELLDPEGRPLPVSQVAVSPPGPRAGGGPPFGRGPGKAGTPDATPSGPRRGGMREMMQEMMGRGMMAAPGETGPRAQGSQPPSGMPFMWGYRWWGGMHPDPSVLFPSLPKGATIRRFWEGSGFGVAIPAQSFHGIIAVHADAESLVRFRRQVGVERLIAELGRESGVSGVTLLDPNLIALASSDPAAVGRQEDDPFLRQALQAGSVRSWRLTSPDGHAVYEVVKPFALQDQRAGLIRLDLSTAGLTEVSRQAQRSILWYSLGLLAVGVVGAVAIFWIHARHLAERRALEAAMAQEQRLSAAGNLAAGVAHEIRNPLNAISIGLQRLRLEFAPPDPESQQEYARFTQIMQAEVARLNTIVDRFLALAGPSRLTLTEEDLTVVLEDLLALLASQAAAQKIQVVSDLRLDGGRVRMDRQTLVHALMNVLLNAMQAMPNGGRLIVRAEATGSAPRQARIAISDTGPGILPEHRERIFEPYFTTKEGGTGLGLALAQKIIAEHHGDIQVEDHAGGGATFVIRLPLLPPGT